MFQLITQSLVEENSEWLSRFPPAFMNENESDILNFIFTYRRTHGKLPTVARLIRKFPSFVEISPEAGIPLSDTFIEELHAKMGDFFIAETEKMKTQIRAGEEVPLDAVGAMLRTLTVNSSTIHRFTSFDRGTYFRHGVPVRTGLKVIDNHIKGIFPGELFTLVARLGTGKSTFMQFFMRNWLLDKKKILCISKEMPATDIFSRVDAMFGHFNPAQLRTAESDENEARLKANLAVVQTIARKTGGEIFMPKMAIWSTDQIEALATSLAVDAIAIDGMYHLSAAGKYSSNWEEVMAISRDVKALALSLDLPILATTQLKRGSGKAGADVTVDDIAFSDAIGQDADFVAALTRLPSTGSKTLAELSLIKNRHGSPIGSRISIDFDMMAVTEII